MDISVLGTEFLVVAYPHSGEQSVLLVKGSVQVTPEKGESVIMVPNQKFIYNKTTASAHVAENVNVLPAIAWKENLLIMDPVACRSTENHRSTLRHSFQL